MPARQLRAGAAHHINLARPARTARPGRPGWQRRRVGGQALSFVRLASDCPDIPAGPVGPEFPPCAGVPARRDIPVWPENVAVPPCLPPWPLAALPADPPADPCMGGPGRGFRLQRKGAAFGHEQVGEAPALPHRADRGFTYAKATNTTPRPRRPCSGWARFLRVPWRPPLPCCWWARQSRCLRH